ncbi:unnamed protein product [Leuciscus chuanchicus]
MVVPIATALNHAMADGSKAGGLNLSPSILPDYRTVVHVHLPGFKFPLPPVKEPWATPGIQPPRVSFIRQQRRGGHIHSTVSPFILSLLAFCTGSHLKHTHTRTAHYRQHTASQTQRQLLQVSSSALLICVSSQALSEGCEAESE